MRRGGGGAAVLPPAADGRNGSVRVARIIARLNIGGPAIQAITLTRELRARSYETLLLRGAEAPSEGAMDDLAQTLQVRPMRVPGLCRDPGWHDLRALAALVMVMLRQRPDIVHTHAAKAGTLGRVASVLAAAALPLRPRPVRVHTFHGHSLTGYFSPRVSAFYRKIERLLAWRTDRLIAVSEQVRDELVALGVAPAEKFEVIPLGFDLSSFTAVGASRSETRDHIRDELGLPQDAIIVTLVARLVPIKRVDRFLRASAVLSALPQLRFLIVGDGELRDELQQSAPARALEGRLTWAGFRRDMSAIYFASDIVVLCSDNEGTPVSLIEASAAGLPVISTRVGGASKVVLHGETGLLVEPDDGEQLAQAIARLAQDSKLRDQFGAAGQKRALDTFDLARLVEDIDRLYRRLLSERRIMPRA